MQPVVGAAVQPVAGSVTQAVGVQPVVGAAPQPVTLQPVAGAALQPVAGAATQAVGVQPVAGTMPDVPSATPKRKTTGKGHGRQPANPTKASERSKVKKKHLDQKSINFIFANFAIPFVNYSVLG